MATWFKCIRSLAAARIRLFCFPCAGASAASYLPWAPHVPTGADLFVLQMPGRGERFQETAAAIWEPLIQEMASAAEPLLDRPFLFFGHSLGTLTCFELTRELRRRGRPLPRGLFVAGRNAPQTPLCYPPVHLLPDAEFLARLVALGGIPREVQLEPELIELLLPVMRADMKLDETYAYHSEPPLDCPISALGGEQDLEVSAYDLDAWREQTARKFQLHTFAGGHFFVQAERLAILRLMTKRPGE